METNEKDLWANVTDNSWCQTLGSWHKGSSASSSSSPVVSEVRMKPLGDFVCIGISALPSVLWRCWLGGRKGNRPVKNWVVGCWRGCLEWGADLHIAQQMPLPSTISCSGTCSPGWSRTCSRRAVKRLCVCVCVCVWDQHFEFDTDSGQYQLSNRKDVSPLKSQLHLSLSVFIHNRRRKTIKGRRKTTNPGCYLETFVEWRW